MSQGTINDPLSLNEALTCGRIKPGHTIYLRAGIYHGNFSCDMSGTKDQPIVVCAYPGERVIIDGDFKILGNYTEWNDIVFRYSGWPSRISNQTGSFPADLPMPKFYNNGVGTVLKRCIIHDLSGANIYGDGGALFDCVSYNIGWTAPDRGHGHGHYIHNIRTRKRFVNSIVFNTFSYGFHAYGEGGDISFISLEQSTAFNAGILDNLTKANYLIGGYGPIASDPWILNCQGYNGTKVNIGYYTGATNVILTNNYFPEGIKYVNATIASEIGNYYGPSLTDSVFIYPSEITSGRGNITIYNQSKADEIVLDISAITTGAYRLISVQGGLDLAGNWIDTVFGISDNGFITVDMRPTSHTVSAPIAWESPSTIFPSFGCFIVEAI